MGEAADERKRALRILARSPNGCIEALMLADGFERAMLGKLRCMASRKSRTHDTMAGSRRMKVVRIQITDAGRKAITRLPHLQAERTGTAGKLISGGVFGGVKTIAGGAGAVGLSGTMESPVWRGSSTFIARTCRIKFATGRRSAAAIASRSSGPMRIVRRSRRVFWFMADIFTTPEGIGNAPPRRRESARRPIPRRQQRPDTGRHGAWIPTAGAPTAAQSMSSKRGRCRPHGGDLGAGPPLVGGSVGGWQRSVSRHPSCRRITTRTN